MKKQAVLSILVFLALVGAGTAYRVVNASDHDDGENDAKSRALNLTDHYVWVDNTDHTKLNLVQTSNPRSLPQYQYFFSTQARYEIHVTRVADKKAVPTGSDDVIFRFEFGAPSASNVQPITLTVLHGTTVVGSQTGATTNFANSFANTVTANSVTIGGQVYKFFAGLREDTFFFDVERYFAVRTFLAQRFIAGNTSAYLAPNCLGLAIGAAAPGGTDGDGVNLFNPPSCASDFTKNYNRNEIVLQVPIAALQANAETTFDTWSTISIPQ